MEFRLRAESVVYVHGISHHGPGYSDSWWDAMRPHLARPLAKTEVVWSDVVNPRSENLRSTVCEATPEQAELRRQIEAELSQRIEATRNLTEQTGARPDITRRTESEIRGAGFSMDDFIRYMLDAAVRQQILQRFDAVVRPLLDDGMKVHVISHSWGTVVAYEGLRKLDSAGLSGRVANLFVIGSALSIGAVRTNLFGRVTDGRRPAHVGRITNLDAAGDPVGGTITDHFDVHAEHLGLQPTGCATIPFTNTAISIRCAHRSYFHSHNVAVNRDILAAGIS